MNRMARTIPPRNAQTFGREQPRDAPPAVRVIPFEYVTDFPLRGEPGNLVQDVINISVEGAFVAVSIGYGLADDLVEPLKLINPPARMDQVTLGHLSPDALLDGFRLDPNLRNLIAPNGSLRGELPVSPEFFQRLTPVDNFNFLLSLVDTGTGRELQNKPVDSLATLGRADGRRPFKMLPQPMVFLPRSTIRVQIEERTAGVTGRLFITLQGYKVLGLAGASEEELRRLSGFDPVQKIPVYDHETGNYRPLGEAVALDVPSTRVVPFDHVSTLDLTGQPGNIVEDEVPINIDGGYVATSISYSLDAGDTGIQINATTNPVDLNQVKLTDIRPVQTLFDGIRVHPARVRFAFTAGGRLSRVDPELLQRLFQSANRPEEVRFLYTINDTGSGRDLQNQRVFNVASLGIADGQRPFKFFHKPMNFLPRSSIRVQVEEIFGRGRLFLVFQGYKILR
ncbi:MAG TPA: hypothetical protein VJ302_37880 [Blastocatellia bacterium]|nr:hypothetical protein [Blastocatellia bacterium]